MAEECIHGLEVALCDTCYPKRSPEKAADAAPKRPSRAAASSARAGRPASARSGSTRPAGRSTSAPGQRLPSLGEQRIYHVTHVRNLAGILQAGGIFADLSEAWQDRPVVDISSAGTREERRSARIGGAGSAAVAAHVPFFLTPDAVVWNDARSRIVDPRLAPDARELPPTAFIMLVTALKSVGGADSTAVVADGDAADIHTRFGSLGDSGDALLHRLNASPERLAAGELLVAEFVPFDRITLIGVAHDNAREDVKRMLESSAHRPRVAVHPPWFQPQS